MDQRSVTIQTILGRAVERGLLSEQTPSALFLDLGQLRRRARSLQQALPGALHTVAVKALPLPRVLSETAALGLGLEVASAGELAIARSLDLPPDRVVFDSPAKTRAEIDDALAWGCRLNVDNLQELERVAARGGRPAGGIGLRINPCLDASRAAIPETFTGGPRARFGVPLDRGRPEILRAFREHPWLDTLHLHIGSQGIPLDLLLAGLRRLADLAAELTTAGTAPRAIDIGGGLPVPYRPGDPRPTFADYADGIRQTAPRLLDGPHLLLTEFGRALLAPCGWVASRVEYTRPGLTDQTAVIHVGADMFVRTAYQPRTWQHQVQVHAADGAAKTGDETRWSIAGPLCFSADYVAIARRLPPIQPGDYVVVRDAGAYTLSMWSRYNSRLTPPAIGHDDDGELVLLKPAETPADLLRFWGA
jgi:diaminopimelate decarboxylase